MSGWTELVSNNNGERRKDIEIQKNCPQGQTFIYGLDDIENKPCVLGIRKVEPKRLEEKMYLFLGLK